MSSDEQGADDVRDLRSSRPFWRHPSITEWLHNIDSVGANLETPRNAAQNGYRRRKSSEVDKESRVVKGLPLNFYDWSYLNNLERPQYLALDPKPVLSLEFSESIQRWVTDFFPDITTHVRLGFSAEVTRKFRRGVEGR